MEQGPVHVPDEALGEQVPQGEAEDGVQHQPRPLLQRTGLAWRRRKGPCVRIKHKSNHRPTRILPTIYFFFVIQADQVTYMKKNTAIAYAHSFDPFQS